MVSFYVPFCEKKLRMYLIVQFPCNIPKMPHFSIFLFVGSPSFAQIIKFHGKSPLCILKTMESKITQFFSMDGTKHSLVVSRELAKSQIIYILFEIGKCDLSSMFSNILVVHPSSFNFRFAVGRGCIHQYCIGNSQQFVFPLTDNFSVLLM